MKLTRRDRIYWKIAALLVGVAALLGGITGGAYGFGYMIFPSIAVAFVGWLILVSAAKTFAWVTK